MNFSLFLGKAEQAAAKNNGKYPIVYIRPDVGFEEAFANDEKGDERTGEDNK